MHKMRNSILTQQKQVEKMYSDDGELKSERQDQEICQRFLRLSCQKMVGCRRSPNLHRNLLILHLLQKARKDLRQVPAECKGLLLSENPIPPGPIKFSALRRSSSRSVSPMPRKSLLNGRSFQSQQTTPKRFQTTPIKPTKNQQELAPQPTTPPPEENLKADKAFALVYQALENDDDVFVDKENKEENSDEDVEELFLQKVEKSFISPPISPEKPILKLKDNNWAVKPKNQLAAGRRLKFYLPDVRNTNGRRAFFGIILPDLKPAELSDDFTGKIQSTPVPSHDHDEYEEDDEEDLPPYLFNCDEQSEKSAIIEKSEIIEKSSIIEKKASNEERVVPTRNYGSSISLCLDSNGLKQFDYEDCCVTDGDYTEEEDESDQADFGQRFPSFKRRLRKRKTIGNVRNVAFVLEKRAKELLINGNEHGDGEHCVPSISI